MKRQTARSTHEVCLLVGSNIQPELNLGRALQELGGVLPIEIVSSVYETLAVGSPGPDFLNVAVLVHTPLDPESLKTQVLRPIEARLGRVRSADKFAPRTLDIDIITYDDRLVDETLWKYAHRAVPVAEILPWLQEEKNGEFLKDAARRLAQATPVKIRSEALAAAKS